MLVVDASVAAKWFLQEADSDEALAILTADHKLIGPTLAKYEVAGAFARRARNKEISADDAASYRDRWLHAIATNVVRLEEDNADIVIGSDIAVALGHPLPDCVYLAMAKRLDVPLVTADDAFAKLARGGFDRVYNIREALTLAA